MKEIYPNKELTQSLMDKETLGRRIVEASYLKGNFTLSSGKKSNYLFDKYAFETQPELLSEIIEHLANMVPKSTTKLAGMEIGAIPLATALSLKSRLPFVIVRKVKKGHGTKKLVEGRLSAGDEVLIIEDVVTTGEQALRAIETLKQAGARVKKVLCVIDREEGGRENIESKGLVFEPLFTKRSLGI